MKQIKLPLLKNPGYFNAHLSVIICEVHGEYAMPECQTVTETQIYSGNNTEEILEYLAYPNKPKGLETDKLKVFDGVIRNYTSEPNLFGIAFDTGDDTMMDNNLIGLTFWAGTNTDIRSTIDTYMGELRALVDNAMQDASGDDDYYDYMPSFVDQYRQLCQYFGGPYIEIYNNMIKDWMADQEDPSIYTETIE